MTREAFAWLSLILIVVIVGLLLKYSKGTATIEGATFGGLGSLVHNLYNPGGTH